MRATPAHVAAVVRKNYSSEYRTVFGRSPASDEEILVDVGKALAAFQETLVHAPHAVRTTSATRWSAAAMPRPRAIRSRRSAACGSSSQRQLQRVPFRPAVHPRRGRRQRRALPRPGLRNVARTAPYMHDGSLATLRDVVRFFTPGSTSPRSKTWSLSWSR